MYYFVVYIKWVGLLKIKILFFSYKVTCTFRLHRKKYILLEFNTFWVRKPTISSPLKIKYHFRLYHSSLNIKFLVLFLTRLVTLSRWRRGGECSLNPITKVEGRGGVVLLTLSRRWRGEMGCSLNPITKVEGRGDVLLTLSRRWRGGGECSLNPITKVEGRGVFC